jgi:hypothetical protein
MGAWPFVLLLLVGLVETVLSLRWNQTYFSVGIPVFRRVLPALDPRPEMPSPERLEAALSKSAFPPLAFRALEADRLAFREKAGGGLRFGYTPVMHGNLTFERMGARVEVVGLLNWFVLAFVGFTLFFVLDFHEPIFLLFLVGLLALIYAIQFSRFARVARVAVAEWSRSIGG